MGIPAIRVGADGLGYLDNRDIVEYRDILDILVGQVGVASLVLVGILGHLVIQDLRVILGGRGLVAYRVILDGGGGQD